jgi:hypothetical protein
MQYGDHADINKSNQNVITDLEVHHSCLVGRVTRNGRNRGSWAGTGSSGSHELVWAAWELGRS